METLQESFSQLNWLAILVAVVANQALGAMWYSVLFGKRWAELVGLKFEEIDKKDATKGMIVSIILSIIAATLIATVTYNTDSVSPMGGLLWGLLAAGFFSIHTATGFVYEQRPAALYRITIGYPLIGYSIMGLIIGAWA